MVRVLILASPLLPGSAYAPLADALDASGLPAEVADAADARTGAEVIDRWRPLLHPGDLLVAHSNSGYLAPSVRAGNSTPVVFVDAALPLGAGTTALAPPALRSDVAVRVDADGRLPPWTRWWPRSAYDLPGPAYDALDAACPRVPLSYLDSVVPVPAGWAREPSAYLALGPAYAEEVAFAREHGWPTSALTGGHLQVLTEPATVAAAIVALAGNLG